MARSRKDGRRGGGHNEAKRTGKEHWSSRPPRNMAFPCKFSKVRTHRAERREAKSECEASE